MKLFYSLNIKGGFWQQIVCLVVVFQKFRQRTFFNNLKNNIKRRNVRNQVKNYLHIFLG